ncbi:MAG TPA: GNAT family N-acetyltransferase [Thermoanaerobaculia bacterium]|jgi:ribosomal protein S18 acetylase RimI-like enzyme
MRIRPLTADDVEAYRRLRAESLREAPLAFAASPDDDAATQPDALRQSLANAPGWMLFGAFDGQQLVGAAGLLRETRQKAKHRAHLWGMYVTPSARGRGIGAMLLDAAVQHARAIGIEWLHLGVTTAAPEAQRLYERAGFVRWGIEPDALRHQGTSVDDLRMALRLT